MRRWRILVNASIAAQRAADALLRCAGGRAVLLRMPAPANAGDATEQLGLAAPEFQDVELAPVVFRRARGLDGRRRWTRRAKWELMVSASGGEGAGGIAGIFGGECVVCGGVWSADRWRADGDGVGDGVGERRGCLMSIGWCCGRRMRWMV